MCQVSLTEIPPVTEEKSRLCEIGVNELPEKRLEKRNALHLLLLAEV